MPCWRNLNGSLNDQRHRSFVSLKRTCLLTLGSYFTNSSLCGSLRGFFLATLHAIEVLKYEFIMNLFVLDLFPLLPLFLSLFDEWRKREDSTVTKAGQLLSTVRIPPRRIQLIMTLTRNIQCRRCSITWWGSSQLWNLLPFRCARCLSLPLLLHRSLRTRSHPIEDRIFAYCIQSENWE